MAIKRIKVKNFKSFKELDVELGKFDIVIGANASGKSNFIHIFEFLKNITDYGLDDAISMQGGIEFFRNLNTEYNENFSIKIISDNVFKLLLRSKKGKSDLIGIKTKKLNYEFELKFKQRGLGYGIVNDKFSGEISFLKVEKQNNKIKEKEIIGDGEFTIFVNKGKIDVILKKNPQSVPIEKDKIFPSFLREEKLPNNTLLLESPFYFLFFPPFESMLSNMSIYDFDPKLPKKATPITGRVKLEKDGNNLSIVLKNIIENKNKKRKLTNLIKDLLPFIDDINVGKFADKSFLFKLREIYSEEQYLPASLISDGTINITALIIALYFEENLLTIIEEPERNLHPYLISKIIDMMKDASQKKQIIVTTHNPEMIKHADLNDILLISRDKEGFSNISRPSEKEEIKVFLKNDMGIEELYVQNLLEI